MKLLAIADNTFREGVRQPFYLLVVLLVVALLVSHYFLPFFTLSDDIRMFKDVCLAYMLVGLLVTALLLASKVVDEEIEARTTLTLMSKPVRRWELIVGKFLGVMAAVTVAWVVFSAVLAIATYFRVEEIRFSPFLMDEEQEQKLADARYMHTMSLLPGCVLVWLQVAVMASISVAISTRAPMIVNMVAGIAIFVVSHLTPFVAGAAEGRPAWQHKLAGLLTVGLPYLENFNLTGAIVYKNVVFGASPVGDSQVAYIDLWRWVGWSGVYAAGYIAFALLVAMALFRTRELG